MFKNSIKIYIFRNCSDLAQCWSKVNIYIYTNTQIYIYIYKFIYLEPHSFWSSILVIKDCFGHGSCGNHNKNSICCYWIPCLMVIPTFQSCQSKRKTFRLKYLMKPKLGLISKLADKPAMVSWVKQFWAHTCYFNFYTSSRLISTDKPS